MTESSPSPRFPVRSWPVRNWSVRSRILTALLLVAAIGLAFAAGTAFFLQRERTLRDIDERLLSRVESARFVLTGEDPPTDGTTVPAPLLADPIDSTPEAVRAVLARVIPSDNESSLGIVDGTPAFVPGVMADLHLEDDPAFVARVTREAAGGSAVLGTAVSTLGVLRYVAVPIVLEGSAERGVYVTAVDIDAELATLTAAFGTYAAVAVVTLIAIGVIGWLLAGRLLRPIRQLRAAASRITVNELAERIPVNGRDDVSELTATVNDMLERIDASVTSQRRLLDDVRHELKTPITIVRGHLELVDANDPSDVAATRAIALDELDRMTVLVDDIELLAQSSTHLAVRRDTDVGTLTDDVFEKARVIPGPHWVHGGTADVSMPLDPIRITQAWLQLADNAAKYSPAESTVRIGSLSVESGVELWVADEGPGIPAEARQRIFERFGRADEGRGIAGSGLGLAIVAAIAHAHGGTVSLQTSSAGSRFAIAIPLSAASDDPGEI